VPFLEMHRDLLHLPQTTKNPNRGVANRRVMEDRPFEPVTVQDVVRRENMLSALRTRMMGVVGRGG